MWHFESVLVIEGFRFIEKLQYLRKHQMNAAQNDKNEHV